MTSLCCLPRDELHLVRFVILVTLTGHSVPLAQRCGAPPLNKSRTHEPHNAQRSADFSTRDLPILDLLAGVPDWIPGLHVDVVALGQ